MLLFYYGVIIIFSPSIKFITISKIAVIVIIVLTIYDSSWVTEGTTFLCAFAMSAGLITIKEQADGYNIQPMQENH